MLVKLYGAAVQGIDATIVTIEVNSSRGIKFFLVGLPDSAVKESHERIMSALNVNGYKIPGCQIVVNMAPADIRKEGSSYDLPLAIGIMAATGIVSSEKLGQYLIIGELSLDGSLQPIKGALPVAIAARAQGFKGFILPKQNAREAYNDIEHLLSRYFIGLIIEILGVALIDFLGLLLIARLGFNASIGIAFICGVLNIIPYVGPLMGGVIGSVLAIVMKYCCALPVGLDVNFWVFIIILIAIFWFAQIIDGLIYQPVIYSNSIKANALEIFIVLLMAGYIGGIIGMLVAIPCYTVIRVIAARFFRNVKFIRKLTGENNR